ncbi:MAG: cytochrome b/b6 domain-containing protein [Halobacteriota archaeon]
MSTSDRRALHKLLTEDIWERYCDFDPRCFALSDAEIVGERLRHSLGSRVVHWLQVTLMTVLVVTGYALWSGNYGPMNVPIWDGYYVAFGLHMWAGIFIVVVTLLLFPFYHVFVDGHRQLAEYSDIVLGINIGLAFLGLREYPPNYHKGRRTWDVVKEHWMVGHPAQKAYFWWISIFVALVALTGFGVYREIATDPVWWVVWLGFPADYLAVETLKQLHLVLAAVITAMVIFHAYFGVMKSNWDFLKSMVVGTVPYYEVESPTEDGDD